MRIGTALLACLAGGVLSGLAVLPAHAQATRTWVSGVGDDANPCSRTAPCKTFAGAISKTAIAGEINCLDPGGFGAVTITKSITIDCTATLGGLLSNGANGVNIALNTTSTADPLQTVRLRNLILNGAGNSTQLGTNGVLIQVASLVEIENLSVANFAQAGIRDTRAAGGRLVVKDTTVMRNGSVGGIVIAATGGHATIDNVHSNMNSFGVAVTTGNKVMINRSVFSENISAGIKADAGAEVNVNNSVISNGFGIGVQNAGTLRLSNNDIAFNATGISGATTSFGNNRISGNNSAGTGPTAAGNASSDLGQQ
jgi:hypothetical protein